MSKTKAAAKVSAGIHATVSRKLTNEIRRDYMQSSERLMNQLKAFRAGKRVMVTIDNPNKEQTKMKKLRVPASTVWRDLRQTNPVGA